MIKTSLIVLGILTIACSYGQTQQAVNKLKTSNSIVSQQQTNLIYNQLKGFPNSTQVSIAIIKNGQVYYYGAQRINDTLINIDNSSNIFEIGSITKVFTSTLLSNFILENKLNLSDPIQKHLKVPLKNKHITVLQLSNHTSGLPKLPSNLDLNNVDESNPYKEYNENMLKEYLTEQLEPVQTPGNTYEYSNIGAGILGYVLQELSQKPYEQLLQEYIFSKYNMINSTTNREKIASKLVDGLDSNGNKTPNWDLNALVGAGGVLSNIEDLSKFALAQFDLENKELELTRQSTFNFSNEMEVGLAWKIIKAGPNLQLFAHNGGTGGYSSLMVLETQQKNGVIVLSNVSAFNKNARNVEQLAFMLMKSLLN